MDNQIKIENWEEKLMDDFCVMFERAGDDYVERLENFISTLLKSQRDSRDKELREKIEAKLVPDEITITSNPRWVYNKAKKDILSLLKEDIKN